MYGGRDSLIREVQTTMARRSRRLGRVGVFVSTGNRGHGLLKGSRAKRDQLSLSGQVQPLLPVGGTVEKPGDRREFLWTHLPERLGS